MPVCPECDSPFDFEEDEVEEGEIILCEECGTEFEVVATDPLELSKVEDSGYEEDDSGYNEEEDA